MKLPLAILAAAVVGVVVVPGAFSAPLPPTECTPRGILRDGSLEHRGVNCPKARRLVLKFMGGSQTQGPHFKVDGFRCSNVEPGLRPGVVCKRGTKLARFLGSPDWLRGH